MQTGCQQGRTESSYCSDIIAFTVKLGGEETFRSVKALLTFRLCIS